MKTHHFQVPMLNFGGVYRKFSKFVFGVLFLDLPKKHHADRLDGRFGEPMRLRRRFRFAGLDVETSALEVGLDMENQSISYTTRKLTKNMSPKKGWTIFSKGSESPGPFFMDFQGKFGYSCVFGDMLVSYSFEIWPSKALLEKQADHCGVGISRSEGRDGWRRQ